MAARRHAVRLSLASAVAAAAVSLSSNFAPVVADGVPFVPRVSLGVRMIRALVSEHDDGALRTSTRTTGMADDGKAAFDENKLIRLGDVDDNGAADYAYVSNSALHLFLFDTDGTVTSHRAVTLNSLAADTAKEAPEPEAPASQVRKALSASSKMSVGAVDKAGKEAASKPVKADAKAAAPATVVKLEARDEAKKETKGSTDVATVGRVAEAVAGGEPKAEAAKADRDGADASDDDVRSEEPAAGRRKLSSVPALERATLAADALLVRPSSSSSGCLFTTSECECDLKSAITGSGTCFTHTRTSNGVHICTERDCAASYVCMCGGSQKCSRSTETVTAWGVTSSKSSPAPALGAGEVYCSQQTTSQATTTLVGPMPTPKPTPPPAGCVLDGSQCTCGRGRQTVCSSHAGVDSAGRNVCTTRSCMDSYQCDCGGSSLCEHHAVTNEFWALGGAAGGGRFFCDLSSKTTTVATCLSNCS
nr:PhF00084.1 [Neoporphyra haitanensis]